MDSSPTRNRAKRAGIRFKTTMHGTVVWQVMLWRGWTETEDAYDWDIFWSASSGPKKLLRTCILSKAPAASALGVKAEHTMSCCRSDVLSVGVDSGFEHGRLVDRQRLNHFPRHMELTRKDLMVKNLKKWKRQMVKTGKPVTEFWPTTFRLPEVRIPSPASCRVATLAGFALSVQRGRS